jgi:hypothetical protein
MTSPSSFSSRSARFPLSTSYSSRSSDVPHKGDQWSVEMTVELPVDEDESDDESDIYARLSKCGSDLMKREKCVFSVTFRPLSARLGGGESWEVSCHVHSSIDQQILQEAFSAFPGCTVLRVQVYRRGGLTEISRDLLHAAAKPLVISQFCVDTGTAK